MSGITDFQSQAPDSIRSPKTTFSVSQVLMSMRERTGVHRNLKAKSLFECGLEERLGDSDQ